MLEIDNQTHVKIDIEMLESISNEKRVIELIIVDGKTMHNINIKQRGIDKPTDVLSFPLEGFPHFPLGSIVINSDLAQIRADELGHTLSDEIILMFIHGFLHLKGYDHEEDDGEMRREEERLIKKFNLPKSLIIRMEN